METSGVRPQRLSIILLYDAVQVKTIPLDPIKASTSFTFVNLLPDAVMGGALLLASETLNTKVTIQSNRLEYIDQRETPFRERAPDELWSLLRGIPNFSVKSYGLNFFHEVTSPHDKGAGLYVAEKYLRDAASLETIVVQPMLSAAVRLFFGTPDHHRDLRITPTAIASKEFIFQYHLHRDLPIADTEKLAKTIMESFDQSLGECEQWLKKLP